MTRAPFSGFDFGSEEADPKLFAAMIAFETLRHAYFDMAIAFHNADPGRFLAVCHTIERDAADRLAAFRRQLPAATPIIADAAREVRDVLLTARTGNPPVAS